MSLLSVHPRRILWPTDFSSLSLRGAHYAGAFRDQYNAELHVVTVCSPLIAAFPASPALSPPPPLITEGDMLGAALAQLRQLADQQFGGRVPCVCEVLVGSPWFEICEYARRHEIDMIVLATHGNTGLRHALIGSVAERVVRCAPCPVLTVKNDAHDFAAA